MAYFSCSKVCWTKLIKSVKTFFKRIVSQFWYDVKKCWKESYRHCVKGCDCTFCWCRVKSILCIVWQTIENIGCTIISILVLFISFLWYCVVFIIAIFRCIVFPCPLPSKKHPEINSCDDLLLNLRNEVNKKLSWLDREAGFVGTPFKETGLANSWDAYNYWVMGKGEIIRVAYSSDGLKTIDIRLIKLAVYNSELDLITAPSVSGASKCNWEEFNTHNPKFIRAEVFPQVLLAYSGAPLQVPNNIIIKGRLMWDRDGWLEIHPKYGNDLQIVS